MYVTQIRKDDAKIHHREWSSEAAALRSAQALANACGILVQVVDTTRRDSTVLIRPAGV